jgi:hypothetical protein
VWDQPVVNVVEAFGAQRSSNPLVIRGVGLNAREVSGASRKKSCGVTAAPFHADHVVRQTTFEFTNGVRRERGLFGAQRRADRRLKPVAKILRRPVVEPAILEREDNARSEIHPRLSVRGSPVGAQTGEPGELQCISSRINAAP